MRNTTLVGNFNYPAPYRIGLGRVSELADACVELGIERPLIVTDPGIPELDWFAPIVSALGEAGLATRVFSVMVPPRAPARRRYARCFCRR